MDWLLKGGRGLLYPAVGNGGLEVGMTMVVKGPSVVNDKFD